VLIQDHMITNETQGFCHVIDITPQADKFLTKSKINKGVGYFFVVGSTAGLTTVEYEPGLVKDLEKLFETLVPEKGQYHHEEAWHDGNGFSHVRASLLKPSLSIPIVKGKYTLGTWQQITLIDFDNRPRSRQVALQLMGEE
jgi:secondary thiamine-phosphate synthase enzyme